MLLAAAASHLNEPALDTRGQGVQSLSIAPATIRLTRFLKRHAFAGYPGRCGKRQGAEENLLDQTWFGHGYAFQQIVMVMVMMMFTVCGEPGVTHQTFLL